MISNLLDRMKLPFRKNKEFLSALYDILGFYPHDIEIYRVAFAHKSLNYKKETGNGKDRKGRERKSRTENTSKPLNNERLEYLGDAVLETVVSDILFKHYPNKREGFLTSTRSKIVQREALNKLATDLGLEKLIQAAQGTRMTHTNIGGNAFEALMGAIYLDRGFRHCHWFIANRVIGHFIDLDSVAQKEVNFKSKLLEWSQKNRINLSFKDFANEGDERGFRTTVTIEGILVGRGTGRSKKESQQEAAKEALTRMRREAKLYDSLFRAKEKRTAMEAEESFALPKIDEIEATLNKSKNAGRNKAETPVLETKGKKKEEEKPRNDSDAAYDTAYDEDAKYEVIDTPAEEDILTAEDYEAKGLPAPPSENDLDTPEEKPQKRKQHTPRTVNDAVKGFKRNERTERPEEIKAAQAAEKAAKAAQKKERNKAKQEAQADKNGNEPQPKKKAAAPVAVESRPEIQTELPPRPAPLPEPDPTPAQAVETEPVQAPQPLTAPATDEVPVEEKSAPSVTDATVEKEVTPKSETVTTAEAETDTQTAETTTDTCTQADEPMTDEAEVREAEAEKEMPETETAEESFIVVQDLTAVEPKVLTADFSAQADESAPAPRKQKAKPAATEDKQPEEAAQTETRKADEAADGEADDATEEETLQPIETEARDETADTEGEEEERRLTFNELEMLPKLRHLSMDDFVFGMEHQEQPQLDDDFMIEETAAPKPRTSSRRRRRKPENPADTQGENTARQQKKGKEYKGKKEQHAVPQPQLPYPVEEPGEEPKPRPRRRRRPGRKKEE